jgi:hypothetical protein
MTAEVQVNAHPGWIVVVTLQTMDDSQNLLDVLATMTMAVASIATTMVGRMTLRFVWERSVSVPMAGAKVTESANIASPTGCCAFGSLVSTTW